MGEPPMIFQNIPISEQQQKNNNNKTDSISSSDKGFFSSAAEEEENFWYGEGSQSTVNIVYIPGYDNNDHNDLYDVTIQSSTENNNNNNIGFNGHFGPQTQQQEQKKLMAYASIVDDKKNEIHRIGHDSHGNLLVET